MKAFFVRYSYDCVKMLLDQVALSMFGLSLFFATSSIENESLVILCSVGSILFYLFLQYNVAWRVGANDHTSIKYNKLTFNPARGLLISLVANLPNLIMGIIIAISTFVGAMGVMEVTRFIALLAQGMYWGVLDRISFMGTDLILQWWPYLLTALPAMLVSTVGYIAGAKDFHVTKMSMSDLPASDRPTRKEIKERKAQEKNDRK